MVDEYLTDDEQAEALKSWWRDNWAWVLSGVVVGLGLLVGWQYYQRYTAQRADAASSAIEEFAKVQASDKARAEVLFKDLTDKYAATPYAVQAQLLQAQNAVDSNDLPRAEAALRAVMADSKDPELVLIAKLRLARVLIEQGKPDDAMALLDIEAASAFAAQAHEVRGDALYAKQDLSGARSEYQAALKAFKSSEAADTSLLELKLLDVGGVPTADTSVAADKASAK